MPIEIETIEITDQLDEAADKSNENFANIKDRLFGENPLGGHCHDGEGSSAIDHINLTGKGALSHAQIDQKISLLEPHANSSTLHTTVNEREAWNNNAQEVTNARTSSVYGQYPSLDARLEFIETSVAPDAHDQMTDRHTTATGSSDNGSRHKATSIWDETRNQTLQETIDNIEDGVVSDDSFVKSGIATVDGEAAEQTFRDRYNWLLCNLPENQLWNGSFSYQGIGNENPPTFRPKGTMYSISFSSCKHGIPGWGFESLPGEGGLKNEVWPPGDDDYFAYSYPNMDFRILRLTSSLPISSSTKAYSYPMFLKNSTVYTFNCYHFSFDSLTCTFSIKIQYSQSDGTWADIASINFTTDQGKVKKDSYAFTSHNYTGTKRGYHRILLSPVSSTDEESFRLGIYEMGVYEGNLESSNHGILMYHECNNLSLGKRRHYFGTTLRTRCFTKSLLSRSKIEHDEELEEYEFQIPKTAYVNRFEISTSYNQIFDLGKDLALEAPALTSGDLVANTSGGTLADGTYYYKITTVNEFGESTGSVTVEVTIVGGDGEGSVSFDFTGLFGDATAIRIYRGINPGQETFIGETSSTDWTDTGNNPNASNQMPSEVPTARLAKYVPYSIDLSIAQDFEDGNLTTLPLSLIGPKENISGYIWIKTQYWPSSLDVPTWT